MTEYPAEWIATSDRRFGSRVRDARTHLEMSQQQLADALATQHGVSWHQTTVGKVEAGTRPVRLAEALAIADVLGVHLNHLVDQPLNDEIATEQRSLTTHARLNEIDNMRDHLNRRERSLRGSLQRFTETPDPGGDDDGEHRTTS